MAKIKKAEEDLVEALCPKCRKLHRVDIFWTGTSTPRLYCPNCKLSVGKISNRKSTKVIIG